MKFPEYALRAAICETMALQCSDPVARDYFLYAAAMWRKLQDTSAKTGKSRRRSVIRDAEPGAPDDAVGGPANMRR